MKFKILAFVSVLALAGCGTPAAAYDTTSKIGEYNNPIDNSHCEEFVHRVVDDFDHVVEENKFMTCRYQDGTVHTYFPEEYRHWGWYAPPVIVEPIIPIFPHDHDRVVIAPRDHRRP